MKDKNFNEEPDKDLLRSRPFSVPEGYFDKFPERVFDRIDKITPLKTGGVDGNSRKVDFKRAMALAAMLVVVIGSFFLLVPRKTGNGSGTASVPSNQILKGISNDEIVDELYKTGVYEDYIIEAIIGGGVSVDNAVNKNADDFGDVERYLFENMDESLMMEEL